MASQAAHDENDPKTHAMITWADVGAPLQRFLLIKKGNDLCAIRFTQYRRSYDVEPPTNFNSGEESFYGEYDWHYGLANKGGLNADGASKGHRKVAQTRTLGIGRLILWGGVDWVRCGSFVLLWRYPTRASFSSKSTEGPCDREIEMAPTRWSDIRQVNPADAGLKWFRCDEKRKPISIPVDEL